MKLTLAEAAIGAGAVLEAPASIANAGALVAAGYSIDSRTVEAGELFFAVRGERLDGHDFVAAAWNVARWPQWFRARAWPRCPMRRWPRRC